ncbi:unnamed protein product [Gordionus sp. m RMFG-2023]
MLRNVYDSRLFVYWCSLTAIIIFYMTSVIIICVLENKHPESSFSNLNQEEKFTGNGFMAIAQKISYYYPLSFSKLPWPQKPNNFVKKPNISPSYELSLAKLEMKRISNTEHSDMNNYIELLNTLIHRNNSPNLERSYINQDSEYDSLPRRDNIEVNELDDLPVNEKQFIAHEDDNQKSSFNSRLRLNKNSFKPSKHPISSQASKTRIITSSIEYMSSTTYLEAIIDQRKSLENLIQRFSVLSKFSRLLETLKYSSEENALHILSISNKLDKATTIKNRIKHKNTAKLLLPLWPEDSNTTDRIMEQLSLAPKMLNFKSSSKRSCHPDNIFPDFFHYTLNNSTYNASTHKKLSTKVIYVATHLHPSWNDIPYGCRGLHKSKCAFTNCYLTDSADPAGIPRQKAHAVLYRNAFPTKSERNIERNPAQIWIFHSLESPMNMHTGGRLYSMFNWTATYRHDSDIVTPYAKYITSQYSRSRESKESKINAKRVNVSLTLNKTVEKYLKLTIALKSHLKSHDTLLDDEIVNRLLIHSYHPKTPKISSLNLSHLYDNLNSLLFNLRSLSFPPKYSLPPSLILYLKN